MPIKVVQLIILMFQTRAMAENHTGVHIAQVLTDAILEWGLPDGNPPLVTDNASNMTVAARELGSTMHIGCFAHTLNLACGKALQIEEVAQLLAKIRRIVAYFHRSAVAAAVLKEKQRLLNVPQHKLIIDVSTRWNSAVDMMARFVEQQHAMYAALMSKELRTRERDMSAFQEEEEVTRVEELLSVLTPLKTATVALCEEKVPTVSIIVPLQFQLVNNAMQGVADDTPFITKVKAAVGNDLCNRYHVMQPELLTATLLDPRFKEVPFLTDEQKRDAYDTLAAKALQSICVADRPANTTATATPEAAAAAAAAVDKHKEIAVVKPSAMANLFGNAYVKARAIDVDNRRSDADRVSAEVGQYKTEDSISLSDDPLLWWKMHAQNFPILSRLAKIYLGIPATSVPSERVFSTAGDIISAQRSALLPQHVDKLIFLKKNWLP